MNPLAHGLACVEPDKLLDLVPVKNTHTYAPRNELEYTKFGIVMSQLNVLCVIETSCLRLLTMAATPAKVRVSGKQLYCSRYETSYTGTKIG